METVIKEIPVTEIQVGDEIFRSSGAVSTTDKGSWITIKKVRFRDESYVNAAFGYEIKGMPKTKVYPVDGFVFVKRQG